jgi:hypothetical protein
LFVEACWFGKNSAGSVNNWIIFGAVKSGGGAVKKNGGGVPYGEKVSVVYVDVINGVFDVVFVDVIVCDGNFCNANIINSIDTMTKSFKWLKITLFYFVLI